jgi:GNAT superfamily N-acetyltransferase
MDETEELIRLCCRALVVQMGEAPGFELHMTRSCVLGLTGEPLADFNMTTLGADPEAEAFLIRSVARARERGLPLHAAMSPNVEPALAPVATRLGLTRAGASPLMVLRPGILRRGTAVRPDRTVKITRALGAELVGVAGDLAAAAFDTPRGVIARCIDVCVTATAGIETWIAWSHEGPMSAVSVTPAGNTAGITLMATPPERQRQGWGRALLAGVIEDYRGRGVERFYLGATQAGLPLYASLGFETIAELSGWVLADPGPAPAA